VRDCGGSGDGHSRPGEHAVPEQRHRSGDVARRGVQVGHGRGQVHRQLSADQCGQRWQEEGN